VFPALCAPLSEFSSILRVMLCGYYFLRDVDSPLASGTLSLIYLGSFPRHKALDFI